MPLVPVLVEHLGSVEGCRAVLPLVFLFVALTLFLLCFARLLDQLLQLVEIVIHIRIRATFFLHTFTSNY